MYKIAIIGATGFASERLLPEIKNHKKIEISAAQARDINKLKKIKNEYAIKNIYTDINLMLKEKYDLIYIATPPFLHLDCVKKCIESKNVKNILCEKPLVLNEKDLNYIKNIKNKNCRLVLGHQIRNQRSVEDLKEIIKEKIIGNILFVSGEWSYQLDKKASHSVWKLDKNKGGTSAMGDSGIHVIDLIYFLFGQPKKVRSFGTSVLGKTIDNAYSVLEYKDKEILIKASQTIKNPKNDLLIIGTNGYINIENCFSQTFIKKIKIVLSNKKVEIKKYKKTFLYKNEVENILGITKEKYNSTTLKDAVRETELLLKINNQLKKSPFYGRLTKNNS